MNTKEPLGLPKGSVRAALALGVTATLLAKMFTSGLTGEELLLMSAVLGGYGLTRAAAK
jgi:hypothetical protein